MSGGTMAGLSAPHFHPILTDTGVQSKCWMPFPPTVAVSRSLPFMPSLVTMVTG
jgi:hypothetical protein